jgi:hypothetical protein
MSSAENQVDAGTNIKNAFAVVGQSYKNVHKFLAEFNAIASDEELVPLLDRFLRWRSDRQWEGWLIWSFIVLFQKKMIPLTVASLACGRGPYSVLKSPSRRRALQHCTYHALTTILRT